MKTVGKKSKIDRIVEREEKAIIKTLKKESVKQKRSYTSMGTELEMSPNSAKRTLEGLNSPSLSNLIKICYGLGLRIEIRKR